MPADLILNSRRTYLSLRKQQELISPLSLKLSPNVSNDFRPSEQIFPETIRWVPLRFVARNYKIREEFLGFTFTERTLNATPKTFLGLEHVERSSL